MSTPRAQPPTGEKPPGKGAPLTRTGAAEAEQRGAQTGDGGPARTSQEVLVMFVISS